MDTSAPKKENMVCQSATVVKYENGTAHLVISQPDHCEGCSAHGHCGVMLAGDSTIEVKYDQSLEPGQRVEIGLMPGAILKASILLFILPAVAFAVGIALGYWASDHFSWGDKQWMGFACGLILTALTYLSIRLMTPRLEKNENYEPVIIRVLS